MIDFFNQELMTFTLYVFLKCLRVENRNYFYSKMIKLKSSNDNLMNPSSLMIFFMSMWEKFFS